MTSGIHRKPPPKVRQTKKNSCWAATLESWSRADSRIPTVTEAQMLNDYNPEGIMEGGIDGRTKLPVIAAKFGFRFGGFTGPQFKKYLLDYLPHSHMFCTYRLPSYSHSVLIYRLSGQHLTTVSFMDPDGGYYGWASLDQFAQAAPLSLMWK